MPIVRYTSEYSEVLKKLYITLIFPVTAIRSVFLTLSAMHYPIPANPQEIANLRYKPVSEELIVAAIAGVVRIARSRGQSLEDLRAEVLADDSLLDGHARRWLSDIVTEAWRKLP